MNQLKSKVFNIHKNNELIYLTIPLFDKTNLVNHCFSTKLGGVSSGIYESLNLGFNRGDNKQNVLENYRLLCNAIDIDYKDLVFSDQVHKTNILKVTKKDLGKGITRQSDIHQIDGLMTNEVKVPLVTLYADCVPIYFLDPVKKVIALAHSGWKGTVNKIAKKMLKVMQKEYNSNSKDILTAIGPSIGSCCFEVDKPVADEFIKNFNDIKNKIVINLQNDKYIIDLWETNKNILLSAGIIENNIVVTDLCTKCNKDFFFSHRGHKGKRGSLVAIMELR